MPQPSNIYDLMLLATRKFASERGSNPMGDFSRGFAGATVGSLPTSQEALHGLGNLLALMFGLPSAYDKLGSKMDAAGAAATDPATYSNIARELVNSVRENPGGSVGYLVGSFTGMPGPMDDAGLNPSLGNYWSAKRGVQTPATLAGERELQNAARRVAARERTVQRRLVEGYEGKATSAPLSLPESRNQYEARLTAAYLKGERLPKEGSPTLPIGPDWAESPGDMAVRLKQWTDPQLAAVVREGQNPQQVALARAELAKRGWRGDISDAEHVAREGESGPLNIPWTAEERGAEMLDNLTKPMPEGPDWEPNSLASQLRNLEAGPKDSQSALSELLTRRFMDKQGFKAEGQATSWRDLAREALNPTPHASEAHVTGWLNTVSTAKTGEAYWHGGKRYFKAERGWSLDPTAEIGGAQVVGSGSEPLQHILPRLPKDLDEQVKAELLRSGPESAVQFAEQATGRKGKHPNFWVGRHVVERMFAGKASTHEVVWYNLMRMSNAKKGKP